MWQPPLNIRGKIFATALAICLGSVGCAHNRFGVTDYTVTLDSVPQGKSAYLMLNSQYLSDTSIAADKSRLSKYYQGKTPAEVQIRPYLWVYIVQNSDGSVTPPKTFNPDDLPDGRVLPKEPQ